MRRVDAGSLVAKMVDLHAVFNRSHLLLVDKSVGENVRVVHHEPAVSVTRGALPDPAACAISAILSYPEVASHSQWSRILTKVADVAEDEAHRLSSYMAELGIRQLRDRCRLTAAALAQTVTAPLHPRGG